MGLVENGGVCLYRAKRDGESHQHLGITSFYILHTLQIKTIALSKELHPMASNPFEGWLKTDVHPACLNNLLCRILAIPSILGPHESPRIFSHRSPNPALFSVPRPSHKVRVNVRWSDTKILREAFNCDLTTWSFLVINSFLI